MQNTPRSRRISTAAAATVCLLVAGCAPAFAQAAAAKSQGPAGPESHFQAAQTFQLAGDLQKAASEYREAIARSLQQIGNLRAAEGNYREAINQLTDAAKLAPDYVDASTDLGIAYFHSGDLAKSKEAAAGVLQRDPSNFRAHNLLGKVHFMQGDFQRAVDELQAAIAVKTDFDVAYTLALANLELKKLPQATVLFDEMQASMPPSAQLNVLIGRAFRETGYAAPAIEQFKKALALDPKYPRIHANLGLAYLLDEEYAKAAEQFQADLVSSPDDPTSWYFLGIAQLRQKNAAVAIASLEKAVRLQPNDPGASLYLGQAYSDAGKWDDAAGALRKAIALASKAPRNDEVAASAHELLATALQKLNKNTEAAAEAEAARQLRAAMQSETPGAINTAANAAAVAGAQVPGEQDLRQTMMRPPEKSAAERNRETEYVKSLSGLVGESYHNLGVIDARAGRYAQAAANFALAWHWKPAIDALDRNWGLAAFRANLFTDAVGPLERQLRRHPDDANVRQMLAVSYYMLDDFTHSAETFRPILAQLPDNPGLLFAAATSMVRTGDVADGKKLFTRMLQHGEVAEVHLVLGQAHAQQSEYADALAEFARALELNSRLPEVHFNIGMVKFKQGKLDQAATEFQAELAGNAGYVPAQYQLAYVRLQQHEHDEAIRLLKDVLARQPAYADAHYQLGKALLEGGDVKQATHELETAVRQKPTDYAYYQLSIAYRRDGRSADADSAMRSYESLKRKAPVPEAR